MFLTTHLSYKSFGPTPKFEKSVGLIAASTHVTRSASKGIQHASSSIEPPGRANSPKNL